MTIDSIESVATGDSTGRSNVQIWFRAPKAWDDFLSAKADEEFCTKSDLLRYAFRQVFGQEVKQFRANGGAGLGDFGRANAAPDSDDAEATVTRAIAAIPVDIQNDLWFEAVAAFIANKASHETRRVYRLILAQFFTFVAKHPSNIRQSDVIRYRYEQENKGKAPSTIRQHLAAVSGYYSFCISREMTAYNPTKGVNRPSVDPYIGANWLTPDQAKRFVAQPNRTTVKGKRDFAILLTLLLTGLRRKEIASIHRKDIQEKDGKVYLEYTCKGGVRLVRDIPRRCLEAIEEYLAASGRKISGDSPVFTALADAGEYRCRNGNGYHPITPEAIRQMVANYSHQAFGSSVHVRPHTLRHTAATLLRKSGRSVEEVQSFLKHKRLDTTRRYLHVVEADDSRFGEYIAKMLDL